MKTLVLNLALAGVVVGLVALNFILRTDPNRRNYDVFADMARSVPYDSFASNPNFADGLTLRAPVPGTVVRGMLPLHDPASMTSPFAANDAAALNRGAAVFTTYCEICHGIAGKGDGPVALRGFPAPPSLLAKNALGLTDGRIFQIITYGQKNMPSYASQIDRDDRWKAILYVRSLQKGRG